jgi:hypothetical protein
VASLGLRADYPNYHLVSYRADCVQKHIQDFSPLANRP